jgi:hypothetical protein
MATCKDCIHYDVCQFHIDEETKMTVKDCGGFFKNKADYVAVVRCKDCKHKQELDKYEKRLYIEGCVACTQSSPNSDRLVMLPNDFCSYGERSDT